MQQDEAVHAQTAPGSSLVLQIDKSIGKQFLVVLFLCAVISGFAVAAIVIMLFSIDSTERRFQDAIAANERRTAEALNGTTAHVNVLQYDLAQVKAQLIERGLYEPTAH